MPKQTRLGDEAHIYQPRQELTEKEKLRDMTFKRKLSYLWSYYKFHAFATIIAIISISYIVHLALTPKVETVLHVAVINNIIDIQTVENLKEEFSDYIKLNPETEKVNLNTNFIFNGPYDYALQTRQMLTTYVVAREIDIIIAPESEFSEYAYHGFFSRMADQLPPDLYKSLADHFYSSSSESELKQEVYGVYLSDTPLYQQYYYNKSDPYIIGIVGNSKNKGNAVDFIRYLFIEP